VELANCQASAAFEATVAKATSTTRRTTSTGVLEMLEQWVAFAMKTYEKWRVQYEHMKNCVFLYENL